MREGQQVLWAPVWPSRAQEQAGEAGATLDGEGGPGAVVHEDGGILSSLQTPHSGHHHPRRPPAQGAAYGGMKLEPHQAAPTPGVTWPMSVHSLA